MSFDPLRLEAALAAHDDVWRVVVAETRGSVPRGPGTSMLVWADGQDGTIGGGRLEWEALAAARAGRRGAIRHALGPSLGQCCGGAVTLHISHWTRDLLDEVDFSGGLAAIGHTQPGPEVMEAADRLRDNPDAPSPLLVGDWLVERIAAPSRRVHVWGAGHVGRALVSVLAPLPDLSVSWIDDAAARFPGDIPAGIDRIVAVDMPRLAARNGAEGEHLLLTYSHDIDLALCHALLTAGAPRIGLIGSDTKWARFRSRLRQLGHTDAAIARIRCPIGNPALGKHPQAIAVGVAAEILAPQEQDLA
ncbi:molybdenum cofactor sulfurylase [Palleronia marisminoris]|uniref:XdhC and CoxI family protein n=1 Tax=Palleronia marisminoris TaxID=315423 RepID=A0A1Y5RU91_9RHOB|nr:xanthine dehydrogenase accessory protein XdhC [Palleronia marisminoris]SFG55144.1 molybdenum cofactor sulfurylase [Palleronia marisminoris]SLN22880.1 XdhC and CoxI family protein [Palleronia marisminoris]